MKTRMLAAALLCLLLSACGREAVWAEVGTPVVDLAKVAGDTMEFPAFETRRLRQELPEGTRPLVWLDEETALCVRDNTVQTDLIAWTSGGRETILEDGVEPDLQAVAQDGSVAYGKAGEEGSLTFARWDGEELDEVYSFQGEGLAGFAQCFTPDGRRGAFSWNRAAPSKDWTIRVVDMKSGKTRDFIPPVWDTGASYIVLFVHWTDNETLQVIARAGTGEMIRFSAWECRL